EFRSATTTPFAPSLRKSLAVASPIPDAAPVTIAVLLLNRIAMGGPALPDDVPEIRHPGQSARGRSYVLQFILVNCQVRGHSITILRRLTAPRARSSRN